MSHIPPALALLLTEIIRTKRLHDLRNVEERDLDRVVLENAQSVLQKNLVAAVFGEQEPQSKDDRNRCPEEQVLPR